MEIKPRDTYRAECQQGISEESLSTLVSLYQPLIGPEALVIYLTLASESRNPHGQDSFQRIFALTSLSADTFERAVIRLEEYMLVRTYYKKLDSKDSYIFVLNAPMRGQDFINSNVYASRLMNTIGQTQLELSVARTCGASVSKQGYDDITHALKNIKNNDYDRTVSFAEIKPQYTFASDETINFDYESFLAKTTSLVFPIELRTQENMALIGRLATVYGLSPERMRILVKECVQLNTMEFNAERLKLKAAKAKSDVKVKGGDIYDLSPVSFLQAKQNGAEVSLTDKKIIEHLSADMHFSNIVINIMLEYILKVSQNRLSPKFIDMVAGEWARDGISTKEQALLQTHKEIKQSRRNGSRVKIEMPEYMKQQVAGQLPEETPATEEQLKEAMEIQRRMKERYGKD